MEEPEQNAPATNFTPLEASWLATATACLGSQASSPTSSFTCSPSRPPLALMSATACSAPALSWAPNEAYWPVMGPSTPIRISAKAAEDRMVLKASAAPASRTFFIAKTPSGSERPSGAPEVAGYGPAPSALCRVSGRRAPVEVRPSGRECAPCAQPQTRPAGSDEGRPAGIVSGAGPVAPAERPAALIEPAILRHHLQRARIAPARERNNQIDGIRHKPVVQRQ